MFSARRTARILNSIEIRTWRNMRPDFRKAEKDLVSSIEAPGTRVEHAQYRKDLTTAMKIGLQPMYEQSVSSGIVEADSELRSQIRNEKGLDPGDIDALLLRAGRAPSVVELADEKPTGTVAAVTTAEATEVLGVAPVTAFKRMNQRKKFLSERFGKRQEKVIRKALQSFMGGETGRPEAVKAVEEAFKKGRKDALRIVRTETTWAYTAGKAEVGLTTRGVTHFLFRSVNDNRRSKICESRDKKVWPVSDRAGIRNNSPPLHPYCRSTWELILGQLPSQRSRVTGPKSVPLKKGQAGFTPLGKGWKASSATGIRSSRRRAARS
jgi:SPP1 gp7 family putative phage head morphogenesis protein